MEVIIRHRVFTEKDYEELRSLLEKVPKGRIKLMNRVEELYYEEALR